MRNLLIVGLIRVNSKNTRMGFVSTPNSKVLTTNLVGNLLRFVNDMGNYNCEPIFIVHENIWKLFYVATQDIDAD